MKSTAMKNAGYLLALLPQFLLVLGVYAGFPWLSVIFFFALLPILRRYVGNDTSLPNVSPSPRLVQYLRAVPRLYCAVWLLVLPWTIWMLASRSMSVLDYIGVAASLWIVCSLNTAIAHELIHSGTRFDRILGTTLDASVGYFHFAEEHLSHHARTGHYHGGDAAKPGTSIYRYALTRYARSLVVAWDFEAARLKRRGLPWLSNRLVRRVMIPSAVAALFFKFAGFLGLGIYLFQVAGSAFSVQAITYLQHWGLSEKRTPELADYGFAWEDGCWMQACVTLNHAYHGQHHLNLRRPYYQLSMMTGGLPLPASYPVMFVAALFPSFFTRLMTARLQEWRDAHDARDELAHQYDCIGAARLTRQIRKSAV